jgi:Glyoxalase-like domain
MKTAIAISPMMRNVLSVAKIPPAAVKASQMARIAPRIIPMIRPTYSVCAQRLGEGTARVHLDIHTDDLDAEVPWLERLGARRVQHVDSWQVMRDPAGMLFCVLPDPPGTLHEGNAHRWP